MMSFEEWLKSEDAAIANLNFDDNVEYESEDFETYLKDKYDEYLMMGR